MNKTVFAISVFCVSIAAIADIRTHKIPNWLTFPTMGLGLVLNGASSGMSGLLLSLEGLGLGFGLLFVVYVLGGMGAGDVKLLSAVGAIVGPRLVFYAFIWTALVGGLMAMALIVSRKTVKRTFHNLKMLILGWILGVSNREANLTIRNQSLITLPYGVAIAIGTTLAVWLQRIPTWNF
jgi:prepilin peptidase CpaA